MQLWEEKLREQMEARAEGKTEGRSEGKIEFRISLIRKKILKNMTPEAIADILEEQTESILPLYDVIKEHPELSDAEIYQIISAEDRL